MRLAALLDLRGGAGLVLLVGAASVSRAALLAESLGDIEWVGADPGVLDSGTDPPVSRMTIADTLPFRDATFRAIAWDAGVPLDPDEVFRVLARRGRLVVSPPTSHVEVALGSLGLELLASDEGATVFTRR